MFYKYIDIATLVTYLIKKSVGWVDFILVKIYFKGTNIFSFNTSI